MADVEALPIERGRLVVSNPALLELLLGSISGPAAEAVSNALRDELVKNVRILREGERPVEPVDEALHTRVQELEREAKALESEVLAQRAKMEPELERRIADAVRVAEPNAEDEKDSTEAASVQLPEKLVERAKLSDASVLKGRIEKLRKLAEETQSRAARGRELLQAVQQNCETPNAEVSMTIDIDQTTTIAPRTGSTPSAGATPRSTGGFSSPETSRVTRSPFNSGRNDREDDYSPRLPTMSPNVTPRTRARRKLLAKGPRHFY